MYIKINLLYFESIIVIFLDSLKLVTRDKEPLVNRLVNWRVW